LHNKSYAEKISPAKAQRRKENPLETRQRFAPLRLCGRILPAQDLWSGAAPLPFSLNHLRILCFIVSGSSLRRLEIPLPLNIYD
jgi:hypothetical protein